jgi:hypothetical protein
VVSAPNNAVVAGATVSTTAGSVTSSQDGSFSVAAGADHRAVVHVEAAGFAEAFAIARVTAGQTTTLGVKLLAPGVTASVTVANGGTVAVPNSTARVDLPANGVVPKSGGAPSGTVNVAVTPVNPAVDPALMPGDFSGVVANGVSPVPIESFGAMIIDVRDNAGTRYNLAAGKTSTIRIPVGTLSANPPATVPLWFFDETTGVWKQEGTASLQGTAPNQYYEGSVTHFSAWNADDILLRTFVTGCVRDTNGQPVAGVTVRSSGIDYTGTASGVTVADGTFRVGVRKGSSATIGVSEWSFNPFGLITMSNTITVGPSDVDRTLPNCLVIQAGPLTITTSALAAGRVGAAYNQTLAARGGIPGYVWSLDTGSNPLPAELQLNPSGVISGTPTAEGTTTITVKVTDSAAGTATRQLGITITTNPSGGAGTLSISGAPADVGGTFVPDGRFTTRLVTGDFAIVTWGESSGPPFHTEGLGVGFSLTTGAISSINFAAGSNGWQCLSFSSGCSGATINRAAGTFTLSNVVLVTVNSNPPITLNGTLNFTPF